MKGVWDFMKELLLKYKQILIIIFALLVPLAIKNQYILHLVIMACIYAYMAIGLDLMMGYTGALSLAQAAFFGIGAYTSTLMSLKLGASPWVGLLTAILITAVISFFVGYISLRSRGISFLIMTFSFSGIAHLVALNWVKFTNGPMGIARIPSFRIGQLEFITKTRYYYIVLFFLVLVYYIADKLVNSRVGRAWIGIRENELFAESLGVNPFLYSLASFIIGSSFAGLSGGLYAHYINFISPEALAFSITITLLVMTVMGGKGTIAGPVIGAFIFTVLPEYLRIADDFRLPIFGIILVILALYIPKGLVPSIKDWHYKRLNKGVNILESTSSK